MRSHVDTDTYDTPQQFHLKLPKKKKREEERRRRRSKLAEDTQVSVIPYKCVLTYN